MLMEAILNATDARANFSSFIDTVVREKPQAVRRNRDIFFSFSEEQLRDMLSVYTLSVEYEKDENGKYVGSIEQIEDIIAEGETVQDLYLELAKQLIEYAKDYYSNYSRYYNSPNRRRHAYYVFRVLMEDNEEKVAELLHA